MGKNHIYRKYLMILKGLATLIIATLFFMSFEPWNYYLIGVTSILFLIIFRYLVAEKQILSLDQKVKELKALDKISRIIDEFPETQEILENITKVVAETMDYCASIIMFYDEEKDELLTKAGYGISDDVLIQLSRDHGKGLERRIIDDKEAIVILNCQDEDCSLNKAAVCAHKIHFSVAVPLLFRNKIIGTLSIYNEKVNPITEEDKELLNMMSSRIGIILENDRLYKEVRNNSITDGLTGLYNHKQFYERLRFEIQNAKEDETKLFLLMVDIDRFKSFNDRFGHMVGDRVLVEVAKGIRNSIRETDVAARYGGEEFAIILSDVTYETAAIVAERIRSSVKRIIPQSAEFKTIDEYITVSIGIACYPNCSNDITNLIDIADLRMYKGKEMGGDSVVA